MCILLCVVYIIRRLDKHNIITETTVREEKRKEGEGERLIGRLLQVHIHLRRYIHRPYNLYTGRKYIE